MDDCKKNFYVTPESNTQYLLRTYPECCEVFEKHEMPCSECMGVGCDTLADCAIMHEVDIDVLVAELRKCLGCTEPPSL